MIYIKKDKNGDYTLRSFSPLKIIAVSLCSIVAGGIIGASTTSFINYQVGREFNQTEEEILKRDSEGMSIVDNFLRRPGLKLGSLIYGEGRSSKILEDKN